MLIIAHRGESHDAPENTLAAIQLAWSRGAAAVEFDVRTSSDGVPVVIHDPDTRRIGGPRVAVRRQPTEALRMLDAGRWKHTRWAGERVPLLREVLESVPSHGRVLVELKEGPSCVPAVHAAFAASRLRRSQVLVMSFNRATVATVAKVFEGHDVALLVEARCWRARSGIARVIRLTRAVGAGVINLEMHPDLGASVISDAHAAGLAVYCWTVNRLPTARRLAAAGVDALTTDRAAWMRARLS